MVVASAPTASDPTLGRGSDPARFPWMGVHSLGSVYSEPEWWVVHTWLGLDASQKGPRCVGVVVAIPFSVTGTRDTPTHIDH